MTRKHGKAGFASALVASVGVVLWPAAAGAAEPELAGLDDVNALWTCLAAFLVFFMQAGFAMVETGLTGARNAVNIVMKNLMDFAAGSVMFWLVGFALMFGVSQGLVGSSGFLFDPTDGGVGSAMIADKGWSPSFGWAFFLFQTVFAGTAATIVSGAMAERTHFPSYLVFSAVMTAIIYPVFGSWAWGGLFAGKGWLESLGFADFAGSTVVHSVGGWAALAGALAVGPRLGRFQAGAATPMPGHNIPLAALGVFILWLGWFGFNPGSTTAVAGGNFAYIAVTTNMAAAGGALAGAAMSWWWFGKPDATFAMNGALAGLVAITAGCDSLPVGYALITGLVAGLLVVVSVVLIDKLRIDDPVGAISVHGVCGAWGTLAVGLFARDKGLLLGGGPRQLVVQLLGVVAAFVWAFATSYLVFRLLKATVGLRVSAAVETSGLDLAEHGLDAYPEFIAPIEPEEPTLSMPRPIPGALTPTTGLAREGTR